ncbi:MAG: translation initiation factor IF-3 [Alphaproteobacteria bacterium]|nr:translation initiation factor IF-3 [Alphaproteobacteria bacterium]MDP6660535.1 translation initiation factor IF-3 [Alphaproteobacteria bacterium]MDP6780576.1 translation initiation factor IF-3 [Alphaproteobacteria bacterium]MDP7044755.1 translation initiation factor IF-3 [Alphaproteobacteria bacterium]HAQ32528.1 translation initiation factor IF-3 [Rhodospirillaceae bacterium]
MASPPFNTAPRPKGPRVNEGIDAPKVRLVGADGEMLGVCTVSDALVKTEEAGLDLVEVSPNSDPPVCKILDYGKYKYQEQKKRNEARKKQKTTDVKEIKMRPNIDVHDYDVKMRSIVKFLGDGDKVKVTLRFRGREMVHQELGMDVLDRVRDDVSKLSKVEQFPKLEGRQMTMVIAPI